MRRTGIASKQLLRIALVTVGVSLLGALVGYVIRGIPGERGFSLGAPPEPAIKIAAANAIQVYVQTASGKYYRCAPFTSGASCWDLYSAGTPTSHDPVNQPLVDDARFAPPPGKIRDRMTATFYDSIGGNIDESRYAVLDNGTVWVWQYQTNQFTNVPQSFDQMVGGGIGLCSTGILSLFSGGLMLFVLRRDAHIANAKSDGGVWIEDKENE